MGHVRSLLWLLLGAVGLVLLIACGNAANLLLARAAGRMRELGVRVALGAGRGRIIRQLITEALLIGLAAGAIGIGLAFAFLRVLPLFNPGDIPRLNEASLDMRVLLFTIAISLLTSALTGVFPPWPSRESTSRTFSPPPVAAASPARIPEFKARSSSSSRRSS